MFETMKAAIAGEGAHSTVANRTLQTSLVNLGYLLEAAAAQDLIARCVAAGLSPADPRLDLLHLNAALKPEAST
jgi:hypothetical protein